ncbi:hypothetical protein F4803DRAFT_517080 [Xylaria telfairii]|nr:hypothetical protein F4803DRAFT_517080 [Xylaria telfairii]
MASNHFSDLFQHESPQGSSPVIELTTPGQASTSSYDSNTPPRAEAVELNRPQPGANGTTTKKLACNTCRDRKVRCDRDQPTCSRCSKLGLECNYSSPSAQSISKADLSRLLLALHDRVGRAETQLASSSHSQRNPQPPSNTPSGPWIDFNPIQLPSLNTHEDLILQAADRQHRTDGVLCPIHEPTSTKSQWSNQQSSNLFSSTFDGAGPNNSTLLAQYPHDLFSLDGYDSIDFTSIAWSSDNSPNVEDVIKEPFTPLPYGNTSRKSTTLLPSTLSKLHLIYFNIFDPVLPMINRSRFQAELGHSHVSGIHVQALSHAIGALGALTVPELSYVAETHYTQARTLLDMCEREESGTTLSNINVLQTSILLALYELKKSNFASAWLTLGRAIRLSKLMCLECVDTNAGAAPTRSSSFVSIATPLTPAERVERRHTFWQLYILDALANSGVAWTTTFDNVLVQLPQMVTVADVSDVHQMPTLESLFESTEEFDFSPFASVVIAVYLRRRCLNHLHASLQDSLYSFWDMHYRLQKLITRCRKSLLAEHLGQHGEAARHPLSLLSSINMAAVEISLCEAVIAKLDNEMPEKTLLDETISHCSSAFFRVVQSVQVGISHAQTHLTFRESSPMFARALATTIQAGLRILSRGRCADQSTHLDGLRLLSETMRELVSPVLIPPGLLEQIDARVDEGESPLKKQRL